MRKSQWVPAKTKKNKDGVYCPYDQSHGVFEKRNLKNHIISSVCQNWKLFECRLCHTSFNAITPLKNHIIRVHDGVSARFECVICKRKLSRRDALKRHMKVHNNNR